MEWLSMSSRVDRVDRVESSQVKSSRVKSSRVECDSDGVVIPIVYRLSSVLDRKREVEGRWPCVDRRGLGEWGLLDDNAMTIR